MFKYMPRLPIGRAVPYPSVPNAPTTVSGARIAPPIPAALRTGSVRQSASPMPHERMRAAARATASAHRETAQAALHSAAQPARTASASPLHIPQAMGAMPTRAMRPAASPSARQRPINLSVSAGVASAVTPPEAVTLQPTEAERILTPAPRSIDSAARMTPLTTVTFNPDEAEQASASTAHTIASDARTTPPATVTFNPDEAAQAPKQASESIPAAAHTLTSADSAVRVKAAREKAMRIRAERERAALAREEARSAANAVRARLRDALDAQRDTVTFDGDTPCACDDGIAENMLDDTPRYDAASRDIQARKQQIRDELAAIAASITFTPPSDKELEYLRGGNDI